MLLFIYSLSDISIFFAPNLHISSQLLHIKGGVVSVGFCCFSDIVNLLVVFII